MVSNFRLFHSIRFTKCKHLLDTSSRRHSFDIEQSPPVWYTFTIYRVASRSKKKLIVIVPLSVGSSSNFYGDRWLTFRVLRLFRQMSGRVDRRQCFVVLASIHTYIYFLHAKRGKQQQNCTSRMYSRIEHSLIEWTLPYSLHHGILFYWISNISCVIEPNWIS